jgi:hypothetical protein
MKPSLIKEAQVLSTLNPSELTALKIIQQASGKTLAQLTESFRPTPRDYAEWLRVIVGYAKDGNMKINTKATFSDIAGAVLENDPADPSAEMHAPIINKLWADFKASKHHAKVSQLANAREEEEQLNGDVDDLGDTHEPGHDQTDDSYEPTSRFGTSGRDELDDETTGETDGDEVVCPDCGHAFHPDDECETDDENDLGDGDEDRDRMNDIGRESGGRDTGNSIEGAERFGKMGGHGEENEESNNQGYCVVSNGGNVADGPYTTRAEANQNKARFYNDDRHSVKLGTAADNGQFIERKPSFGEEEERTTRRGPMSAKIGEEISSAHPKPKSILHQVLTAPKTEMNDALKDIESDGTAAWVAHKLPSNPHTKGSLAHRKWNSGLTKAMKSHLGLDAKPLPAKPKKR